MKISTAAQSPGGIVGAVAMHLLTGPPLLLLSSVVLVEALEVVVLVSSAPELVLVLVPSLELEVVSVVGVTVPVVVPVLVLVVVVVPGVVLVDVSPGEAVVGAGSVVAWVLEVVVVAGVVVDVVAAPVPSSPSFEQPARNEPHARDRSRRWCSIVAG